MNPTPKSRTRKIITTVVVFATQLGLSVTLPLALVAQGPAVPPTTDLPSIAEKTEGMEKIDGFLPLYWDEDQGQLWMEIPHLDQEMIH